MSRNEDRPTEGIDTLQFMTVQSIHQGSRNEDRPTEGIDTEECVYHLIQVPSVEMRIARLRALTH